ncbi:plasmid stabilization protein [Ramlibacter sp. AN1015]|uniref:plasmid stabilization protein n=1 Tax=Ramlibacter sp. AN1015 TaxID=3133428 RepID=UPI0030BCBB17
MPKAWSNKRERQYEHIKEGYEQRGKSEDTAEEIAARTVNKERREEGETKQQHKQKQHGGHTKSERASASGSSARTRDELYEEARRKNVHGRSSMNKEQLKKAVQR